MTVSTRAGLRRHAVFTVGQPRRMGEDHPPPGGLRDALSPGDRLGWGGDSAGHEAVASNHDRPPASRKDDPWLQVPAQPSSSRA